MLLGEELGYDFEVVTSEKDIGAFSLDILAKEIGTDNYVAIENQIEITDHTHLGQLLTYASGVDAKIIIWVSKEVREEHRKAIDWLNQNTKDIENELGELSWERLDDKNACRIAIYTDVTDDDTMIKWSVDMLRKFKQVFNRYI